MENVFTCAYICWYMCVYIGNSSDQLFKYDEDYIKTMWKEEPWKSEYEHKQHTQKHIHCCNMNL